MKIVEIRNKIVKGKICDLGIDSNRYIYIIIKYPNMKKPIAVRIDQQIKRLMAS